MLGVGCRCVRRKGVKVFAVIRLGMRRWRLIGPYLRKGRWCTTHARRVTAAAKRASDFRSRSRCSRLHPTTTTAIVQLDFQRCWRWLLRDLRERSFPLIFREDSGPIRPILPYAAVQIPSSSSSETMGGNYWQSHGFQSGLTRRFANVPVT